MHAQGAVEPREREERSVIREGAAAHQVPCVQHAPPHQRRATALVGSVALPAGAAAGALAVQEAQAWRAGHGHDDTRGRSRADRQASHMRM